MRFPLFRTFRFFWKYFRRHRLIVSAAVLSMTAVVAIDLFLPYLFKIFFDTLGSAADRGAAIHFLTTLLLLSLFLHLVSLGFRRLGDYLNIRYYIRIMSDMSCDSFECLHRHSYDFFNNNFTGSLVKKANRLVGAFEAITDKLFYDLIPLTLMILAIFFVLLRIHPLIGLIMLTWTILFILFNAWFIRYKWKFDLARSEADTRVTGALADTITNQANVKFFASLSYELGRFRKILAEWASRMSTCWSLNIITDTIQGAAMSLLEFLVFYVAIGLWKKSLLTVGDFVWIQFYLIGLFMRLWNFGRVIRDLYARAADADEMVAVFYQKQEVRDVHNAKSLRVPDGKIEFENVSFSYGKKGGEVIHDLSFKIKPGEKVALIGPSGGGKSTVTKLLLRLFDVQKGRILIDRQDISKMTQESLRSAIGFVPQDPILFHRTLMENIRYGRRDATDQEVSAAARLAHCEFIDYFPQKYHTYVGERGVKLSGGERQRVAIARAILANAPILILDEATSSLDSESEALIQSALENLMRQKTTLVIAHRLSTIMKMDRIFVFSGGRIEEEGSHADLLMREAGLYKRLWNLQVGGYLKMSND